MTDVCAHKWGEAEECETPIGTFLSPVCRECGAVKLEVERYARRRFDLEQLLPKPRPSSAQPSNPPRP